jgi:hypothetical protein
VNNLNTYFSLNISLLYILLIVKLSKRAHELAKCIYSNNKSDDCKNINAKEELKKVEDEIDLAVAELYGITKEELEGFKELMDILSGK